MAKDQFAILILCVSLIASVAASVKAQDNVMGTSNQQIVQPQTAVAATAEALTSNNASIRSDINNQQQQLQISNIKTNMKINKNNNYKLSYEVCKIQLKIGQQITNLTQIIFHPSDICSPPSSTSSSSNQHDPTREDHPWFYIEHLNLSQNNLTVLHESSNLNKLVNLLELKITHNQLARCAENSLNGLKHLQILDISHNKLQALPSKFFQPVKATITKLNLSFNSMSVLVPYLFDSLNQLEYLDLSHNEITSHWINDELFKNLTQLRYLDLSFNRLTVFNSPGTFGSLQQLETLSLQHNELRQVPETIQHLSFLSSLDLSQNSIQDISNASYKSNCRLLFNLNLQSNLIENVTASAFRELPALKVLNLANNRIHHLDQQAFEDVPDLHALRLDSNGLVDFGNAFVNLRFLLMLNISSNRISSFDYAQIPFGLQWLDLHSNKIDRLNNFYYSPMAQQQINENNNQQQQHNTIGQQWQSLLRLTTLDASFNLIKDLDNTSLPESLETVQLNNNQIRNIASHTFSTKSNLTRINLSHNQLSTMPLESLMLEGNGAFNGFGSTNRDILQQKFVDIYLANNPYLCNCSMGWLTQLLLASSTILTANQGPTLLREHQLILARQLPRVADAHLVTCHLPLARQSPLITMDPYQWSPVMAANQLALHHNHHLHLRAESSSANSPLIVKQSELLSNVHLCPYKSHCFAMCYCCDFDACDCEMSCPENCSCYYGQNWSTNIVDCSANNQMNSQTNFSSRSHSIHRPTQPVKFLNIPEKIPMDVTELYLDGLELHNLRGNSLIGRRNLKSLYLNNSQVQSIEQKAFATQKSLRILQLNSNYLSELHGYEFEQQFELRELYLAYNQLTSIANNTFTSLKSLQILHLQNNQLYHLNFWSNLPSGHKLISVNFGSNPWSCQCDHVESMLKWLRANSKHIHDRKSIGCQYNRTSSLHLMPPLMTSSAAPIDFEESIVHYESSSENYPMFDVRMCLNHTVYSAILQPILPPMITEVPGSLDSSARPDYLDPLQYPRGSSFSSIGTDDQNINMSPNIPPNDEPSRPINQNQYNQYGDHSNQAPPSPSRVGLDLGIASNGYQFPPPSSANSKASAVFSASFLLGGISLTLILVVVVLSLIHYRRSLGMQFYSRYGLNMFSAKKSHHHHSVGSLGKHSALHHPHLHHHHHSQYGASSAGSTSSSSAASSNLSQALCQQQQQSAAAAASGLVTTPLIVSNNNHQLLNSTGALTTTTSASSPYNDNEKLFDAYLTYSKADEQFINDYIAPELEYGQPSYRVALHYRDLPTTTSEFLNDCIIETANASRRIILVLSEQLLKTEWRNYEFKTAHLEALRHNYRHRLIIVMLGQPSLTNIDPDMLHWLKSCACIQWGDKMFWQRLRFSMPDLPFNRQQPQYMRYQTMGLSHNNNSSSGKQKGSGNLGANLLKSAGLLVGAGGGNHHLQQQPMQQLVTGGHHLHHPATLSRPLPQPNLLGGVGSSSSSAAATATSLIQSEASEQHHYAHLTPATMIYNKQQAQHAQHTYHQPIYGDPKQQQQHQQASNDNPTVPVHI